MFSVLPSSGLGVPEARPCGSRWKIQPFGAGGLPCSCSDSWSAPCLGALLGLLPSTVECCRSATGDVDSGLKGVFFAGKWFSGSPFCLPDAYSIFFILFLETLFKKSNYLQFYFVILWLRFRRVLFMNLLLDRSKLIVRIIF